MIILRLEYQNGKGIFVNRRKNNAYTNNYLLKEYIDELARRHLCPFDDWENGMREWEDVRDRKNIRFAFTEYALLDEDINRLFLNIVMCEGIKLRIIDNPEIVWVSKSGWQVCFIDKGR